MINPQQPVGPDPAQEFDSVEYSIEVPVLVTIDASQGRPIDDVKREAIQNLAKALEGRWDILVDAGPDDCWYGFV